MALIIKCTSCRKRLMEGDRCPCGSDQLHFSVDYWPEGRYGKRVRKALVGVTDIELAKGIEFECMAISKKRKADVIEEIIFPATSATFDELFPDYLRDWAMLHLSKASFREREYTLEYISKIIGKIPVMSFNQNHIAMYQRTRKSQGVSNRTVNKELVYISGFLKWCRDERQLNLKPVVIKKLPYKRPIPIVLSPGEVVKIINAAEPFFKAFFLCLYSLGLRFSEASHLKRKDIDFENKSVVTVQKGGEYKILPLNDWLESAFISIGVDKTEDQETYIFKTKRTGRPIVNVKKAIERAVKKAGIQKNVYPHLFRHSIATHMMSNNVNIRKIQAYLGHSEIEVTEWYTHVVADHLREVTKEMFEGMSTNTINNTVPLSTNGGKISAIKTNKITYDI